MLANPPALYFSKPDVISLKKVESVLIDAIDSSSSPQILWSIENKKEKVITVKVVVRNKHIAFLNINYDQKKIRLKYKNSHNLKYKKINNSVEVIHPNYHKWVNYLIQKIKFSVEKNTQYSLLETDPAPRLITKGSQLFVIAAQAEPGNRDDDYELSDTIEEFSEMLLKRISKSLIESDDRVSVQVVGWGDTIKNLLKESRKKEINKNLCATYKADKILYADAPRMPGGQGTREIMYYLYS